MEVGAQTDQGLCSDHVSTFSFNIRVPSDCVFCRLCGFVLAYCVWKLWACVFVCGIGVCCFVSFLDGQKCTNELRLNVKKPVFSVVDQGILKPVCSAQETS